jgi:hypothetical protein
MVKVVLFKQGTHESQGVFHTHDHWLGIHDFLNTHGNLPCLQ